LTAILDYYKRYRKAVNNLKNKDKAYIRKYPKLAELFTKEDFSEDIVTLFDILMELCSTDMFAQRDQTRKFRNYTIDIFANELKHFETDENLDIIKSYNHRLIQKQFKREQNLERYRTSPRNTNNILEQRMFRNLTNKKLDANILARKSERLAGGAHKTRRYKRYLHRSRKVHKNK
jgi:hypothetical protein